MLPMAWTTVSRRGPPRRRRCTTFATLRPPPSATTPRQQRRHERRAEMADRLPRRLGRRVGGGLDHRRRLQPEAGAEPLLQHRVAGIVLLDRDANDAAVERDREQPGNLRLRHAHQVGDLALAQAVDVVKRGGHSQQIVGVGGFAGHGGGGRVTTV
jgi:hypothetical protein